MIRQDFEQLPPKMYLMQITDDVTKLYIDLWDRRDKENRIWMTWNQVIQLYNKNGFRSKLRKLNNTGLLSYVETDDYIAIELVDWDDIEE